MNLIILGGLNLDHILGAGIHVNVIVSDAKIYNYQSDNKNFNTFILLPQGCKERAYLLNLSILGVMIWVFSGSSF